MEEGFCNDTEADALTEVPLTNRVAGIFYPFTVGKRTHIRYNESNDEGREKCHVDSHIAEASDGSMRDGFV